jgi:hypothetical protein
MKKLNILVFAKPNHPIYFFIRDFINELGKQANVQVWNKDNWEINYILKVLRKRNFTPDFIFHYDFAYNYALSPKVHGLNLTGIPKGICYVDLHVQTEERKEFVEKNGIDMVFSPTKDFFYRTLPELKDKFRWLPFSINPNMFKDWELKKDIDFLLMGHIWCPWYSFRNKVVKRMKDVEGFVYHKHPVEAQKGKDEIFIGEKYAREINRAKIFFTCGTIREYPVIKYFEVPACNTLLIAKGNKDLKDLGFISGENYVECTDENFYELGMYYLENEVERKRIARNGYELVHSRHTDRVRVAELISAIRSHFK